MSGSEAMSSMPDMSGMLDKFKGAMPDSNTFKGMGESMSGLLDKKIPTMDESSGSMSVSDIMKNKQFQQYLANMGEGMMNKRDLNSAMAGGITSANKGLSEQLGKEQMMQEMIMQDEEKLRKLQEAMKGYDLSGLLGTGNQIGQLYNKVPSIKPLPSMSSGLLK